MRPVGTGPEPETSSRQLTTDRLVIRGPGLGDVPALYNLLHGEPGRPITQHLLWDGPSEMDEVKNWCETYANNGFYQGGHHWVIALANAPTAAIGAIGVRPEGQPGRADIGYWLSKEHWGQGLMTEAVQAVAQYGFVHLNLHRLEATAYLTNPASSAVLQKAGFQLETVQRGALFKAGSWVDAKMWVLLRPDWEVQPSA